MVMGCGSDICCDQHCKFCVICIIGLFSSFAEYPYPTRMPSSMSVGATESAKSTTNLANCLTLMMYLGSSESALMILVHRATYTIRMSHKLFGVHSDKDYKGKYRTCNGCSFCNVCLSAAKSHNAGAANPVSLSLMPVNSLTCLIAFWMSSSMALMLLWYCPCPCRRK